MQCRLSYPFSLLELPTRAAVAQVETAAAPGHRCGDSSMPVVDERVLDNL